jgi:hypothetical protein
MTINYIKKNVYGNEMLYIVGDAKEFVARLTGKKTVDEGDIKALKNLGLTVEYLAQ